MSTLARSADYLDGKYTSYYGGTGPNSARMASLGHVGIAGRC